MNIIHNLLLKKLRPSKIITSPQIWKQNVNFDQRQRKHSRVEKMGSLVFTIFLEQKIVNDFHTLTSAGKYAIETPLYVKRISTVYFREICIFI